MSGEGIVVIGGGHGGSQLVTTLRSEGYDGRVTLVSAEADLPYQRPPLSKAFLKDPEHDLLPLRPALIYEKNRIDLRLGMKAEAIDLVAGVVRLADGNGLPFEKLALAPGARARLPAIAGMDLDGVFALRIAGDARAIRHRLHEVNDVVVVGGGFIGLEIAATARLLGKTVTVLEAADRLMGRVAAPAISRHFLALHRGWGAVVRLDTGVGRIVGEAGRVAAVETVGGESIPAEMAIIGIGAIPNVELAQEAGLVTANGIVVDERLTTSDARVVAIGDCVSFHHWQLGRRVRLKSVQNAVDQGKAAARTLLGKGDAYHEVPWFWSDQGDVKLQMAGLSFDAGESVVRGHPDDGSFSVFHYSGERLLAVDSVNRAADHMIGRRLIAAGINPPPDMVADADTDLKALLKPAT